MRRRLSTAPHLRAPSVGKDLHDLEARLYQEETQRPVGIGALDQVPGVTNQGYLDSGFSYVQDADTGLLTPSHGMTVVFSLLGSVSSQVGVQSPPHVPLLGYVSKAFAVVAGLGTTDGSDNVTVGFYLNGSEFTSLTVPAGDASASARGSWPLTGADTDLLTVAVDSYSGSTAAGLTAQIRYL